ncbi:glycosyl transferase family 1 [Bacteroidia bacterium]|nr:glycosyl transferase family 1 [Bacteroidia bacterium]
MKILIITYYFPPSGGSGVQRWLKFVKYLQKFDWQPVVLTVKPEMANFPHIDHSLEKDIPPEVRVERTDTFEVLNLYKKVSAEKEVPFGNLKDKTSLLQKVSRFIRGNFFLPDPRRGWNKYACRRACRLIETEKIEYIVTTSPPHSTQLIGLRLKKKFPKVKWIADFRDPWTDIHYYKMLYPTKIADRINKNYERKVLETADKIIVTHEGTRNVFLSKSEKILPEKIAVITNGFDEDDFLHIKESPQARFTLTYIGILYNSNDIKSLLAAFSKMQNRENCRLRFVGQSGSVMAAEIEKYGLKNEVEILPQVSHTEAVQLMADSSLLVLLAPNESEAAAFLPGKLFEYLAARRPILCIAAPDNGIRKIIADSRAGQSFDYAEETAMLQFLEQQKSAWENGNTARLTESGYLKYSRRNLTAVLAKLLNDMK